MSCRSNDGYTLLITSSDGFCSNLNFSPGELGIHYQHSHISRHVASNVPSMINTTACSSVASPSSTPITSTMPPLMRNPSSQGPGAPSPSPFTFPGSPARSMSAASMAAPEQSADTPEMSSVPSLMATSFGTNNVGGMPIYTPPQTPGYVAATPAVVSASVTSTTTSTTITTNAAASAGAGTSVKRENDGPAEEANKTKRRRIAPTLISADP
jgi:chromatin assembly factor 1 subunit B